MLRAQGQRTDLTSGKHSRSWTQYCEGIGSSKRSVDGSLKKERILDEKISSGINEGMECLRIGLLLRDSFEGV